MDLLFGYFVGYNNESDDVPTQIPLIRVSF